MNNENIQDPYVRPQDYKPPQTDQELLARYANGERYFEWTILKSAFFGGANLRGANFRGVSLGGCFFGGAILIDTDFKGANLHGAIYDEHTRFSPGFDPHAAGMRLRQTTAPPPAAAPESQTPV